MNGAEALIKTLCEGGVEVCFANPGTSEMQLVAAIGQEKKMRAVLGLFEGVVTGAADGYGRVTGKPAATLLHLGPGLGNGLANLHNAKRAKTPMINIVGDHAVHHLECDAPLTSDIVGVATPMSDWVRTSRSPSDLAIAGAEALCISQEYPGKITTIIAPGDHAWTENATQAPIQKPPETPTVCEDKIIDAVNQFKKPGETALFLGGTALHEESLFQAGRISAATGARIISDTSPARLQRGRGRVTVERIPYFAEMAVEFMSGIQQIIFVGTKPPVSFFAYPDKPSKLSPENAYLCQVADARIDALNALTRIADAIAAPTRPAKLQESSESRYEDGKLNSRSAGIIMGKLLPENAIISDEGVSSGGPFYKYTAGARRHDWMCITGGAIGQGLPLAVGAAIAAPNQKVFAIEADGSGMYTVQALWTMARENLDIITIILKNNSYGILNVELSRVGVENPTPKTLSLLDLSNPVIDWVSVSEGLGVSATSAETTQEFYAALTNAILTPGPHLIEAVLV